MTRMRPFPPTIAGPHLLWIGGLLLLVASGWLALRDRQQAALPVPDFLQAMDSLTSGTVASMESSAIAYGPGWRIGPAGADPTEPDDPWNEPAGQLRFTYTGRDLALLIAAGDYWGYLFVTVDGAPANRLAHIPGNPNSAGQAAGYRPLLAPERQTAAGPEPAWVPVHRAANDGPHEVTIEVWRSWGQIPLRGVAVDGLPAPALPLWPGIGLGLVGIAILAVGLTHRRRTVWEQRLSWQISGLDKLYDALAGFINPHPRPLFLAVGGVLAICAGVVTQSWLLTDAGLILLALTALICLEVWAAALLFGLPFYLHPLPILPGRGLNLIEVGVWGGLGLLAARWVLFQRRDAGTQRRTEEEGKGQKEKAKGGASERLFQRRGAEAQRRRDAGARQFTQFAIRNSQSPLLLLICLALLSALAADYPSLALREWRTVFLAAGGFALLLGGVFALADDPARAQRRLVNGWLAGGTAVALIALWQFVTGEMIIQAEGVTRVRGLYGSPNNLALYLERTLAVGIGYWILGIGDWGLGTDRDRRKRQSPISNLQSLLLLPQVVALVLTFSKGALFLGFPALLLVLGGGGVWLLARQGRSMRFLWWLAGIGAVVVLGVLPFLGAERFRLLLDFGAGTTGGLRLSLWRSAWAMALDHPWLGVGPDNFLYAYRSGYILPAAWQDPHLNHPHNFVLDWWTRLGLPGLVLAAVWIGGGVRRLGRMLRAGVEPGLALGALAAIAASLAHGLIDASYALPDLMVVWVLLLSVDKRVSRE